MVKMGFEKLVVVWVCIMGLLNKFVGVIVFVIFVVVVVSGVVDGVGKLL